MVPRKTRLLRGLLLGSRKALLREGTVRPDSARRVWPSLELANPMKARVASLF